MSEQQQLYTVREVATLLRFKEATVSRLLREGKLEGIKIGKKSWRITQDAIDNYIGK